MDVQTIEGFEVDEKLTFNDLSRAALRKIQSVGCAYLELDDSPEDAKTKYELEALNGEHFDVMIRLHDNRLYCVDAERFKVDRDFSEE